MSTKAHAPKRLPFIDVLRGLAVVFMIPLHTSHGWVAPDARAGNLWSAVQFFGGLAAPLFLTLAGTSFGLRLAAGAERGRGPRLLPDLGRALQLVVLGYTLRWQMWILDGAAYAKPHAHLPGAALLGAYALAYVGCGALGKHLGRALGLLGLGVALAVFAFGRIAVVAPERVLGLLRVDVLQCIGGSLALVAVFARLRGSRAAAVGQYFAVAIGAAWLAVWTRSWVPGPLPGPLAAYLGQWPAAKGLGVVGLFPLLPWLAYTCFGAGLGLVLRRAERERRVVAQVVALCALGALAAVVTSESLPHVFGTLGAHPWLTQPVRVAHRVGLVCTLLGLSYALTAHTTRVRGVLDDFGRTSLLVYWVHLEFAFGAASQPISRQLSLRDWAAWSALLICAMWLVAYARLHLLTLFSRVREGAAGGGV